MSETHVGVVRLGTALQARKSRVRFPIVSLQFLNDMILLCVTQPLAEVSNRNISRDPQSPVTFRTSTGISVHFYL